MIEEWGTPVSKGKIIDRRNRLIEYQKLGELRFTPLYEAIDENILDINYMIYEIERLNNIIKEVREYIKDRYNGEVLTHTFDKDNVGELLEILDKGE